MNDMETNFVWPENTEEHRQFFANLSYSERLRYFFELRRKSNLGKEPVTKGKIFKIYHSHEESQGG